MGSVRPFFSFQSTFAHTHSSNSLLIILFFSVLLVLFGSCECGHAIDMDIKMNGILTWDLPVSGLKSFHSWAVGLSHTVSFIRSLPSLLSSLMFWIALFFALKVKTEKKKTFWLCVCAIGILLQMDFDCPFRKYFSLLISKTHSTLIFQHAHIDMCHSYECVNINMSQNFGAHQTDTQETDFH